MIFGIGIDIVAINRMQKNIDEYGCRFAEKILSRSELEEFSDTRNPAHFLAKHFAAKEAFSKAFGTGLKDGINLKSVSISHLSSGKPVIKFDCRLQDIISEQNILSCHLSLSDEKDHAVACVILET